MEVGENVAEAENQQAGGLMFEMLPDDMITHVLSYLDYASRCRFSMTNSMMEKAANDNFDWRVLYHKVGMEATLAKGGSVPTVAVQRTNTDLATEKENINYDFNVEQEAVNPPNGWISWKDYYAVTKAIMGVNARFYNIIRERSLPAMSSLWLNANRLNANQVECIHGPRRRFTGYDAVINEWALIFSLQGIDVRIQNVRARISVNIAVVTMDAYVNGNFGPFYVTNVYEFHDGQWFIVHHHSSIIMMQQDP